MVGEEGIAALRIIECSERVFVEHINLGTVTKHLKVGEVIARDKRALRGSDRFGVLTVACQP
jgi:hypothetical protein